MTAVLRTARGLAAIAGVVWFAGCQPIGAASSAPSPEGAATIDAPGPTPDPGSPPSAVADTSCPSNRAQDTLDGINRLRADRRLGALRPNPSLRRAAVRHAEDLARNSMRGHRGSDGSMPADRASRAGYAWTLVGENVAGGYSTPASVIGGWMASPPHRENLLNPGFTEAGIAVVEGGSSGVGLVWVLVLGDRAGAAPGASRCAS